MALWLGNGEVDEGKGRCEDQLPIQCGLGTGMDLPS